MGFVISIMRCVWTSLYVESSTKIPPSTLISRFSSSSNNGRTGRYESTEAQPEAAVGMLQTSWNVEVVTNFLVRRLCGQESL